MIYLSFGLLGRLKNVNFAFNFKLIVLIWRQFKEYYINFKESFSISIMFKIIIYLVSLAHKKLN